VGSFNCTDFLRSLTECPGVYRMFDKNKQVIYVGKAKNLKKRLSSYFQATEQHVKTQALVSQIVDIEVTVTHTEKEALILECYLIKSLKPRYNILLKDNKSYPYIRITKHPFSRIELYRGKPDNAAYYFGPYPSSFSARESLQLLQKLFPVRQCSDTFFEHRSRPCLQYQLQRCSAPCVDYIDQMAYQQDVNLVMLFLKGKNSDVLQVLVDRMQQESEQQHFERAAYYRDQIALLRKIQEQQYVEQGDVDADVFASASLQGKVCIYALSVRAGRVLGGQAFFPKQPMGDEELLMQFIAQYYLTTQRQAHIPALIIASDPLQEEDVLTGALSEAAQQQVKLICPQKGEKQRWLALAQTNAIESLSSAVRSHAHQQERLAALQTLLNLDALPNRLECFDISHTMGEATVGSCVVFEAGMPANHLYRRFNITDITPGDDYAAMRQVLYRRYQKAVLEELPDIIFIDGGKGQLNIAQEVMQELGLSANVRLVSIVKGEGRKAELDGLLLAPSQERLSLDSRSLALHLIQHLRDEAHRFAITGHRRQRAKKRLQSSLELIPGIGKKRRQGLLTHFGGLKGIKEASIEALTQVPGISLQLAKTINDAFQKETKS